MEPKDFIEFVQDEGGTAECARKMATERKAAAGASGDAEAAAAKLIKERSLDAPKIKAPKELGALKERFVATLVRVGADGICPVLGYLPVPAGNVGSYRRLKAKKSAPAARKRP